MCSPLCVDPQADPEVHAINAASAAVLLAGLPTLGPVAAVRVAALRSDGTSSVRFVLNPTRAQRRHSLLDLIVAANARNEVLMLEGSADQVCTRYDILGLVYSAVFAASLCILCALDACVFASCAKLPVEHLKQAIGIALGATARIIGAMRELKQRMSTGVSSPSSASASATSEREAKTIARPAAASEYFTNPIVNVPLDVHMAVRQLAYEKVVAVLRTASHDKISRDEAIADIRSFVLSRMKGTRY